MYLDIAIGLIVGLIASIFTGETDYKLVSFGVIAALAPDLDFLIYLFYQKGKIDQYDYEHRDLLHKPLYFSVGIALLLFLFNPRYAGVWLLGTLWHFIHDTFDGGWGIRWLHPFSYGYYTLVPHSPKQFIRDKNEQHALATKHGDPDWLRDGYLRFSKRLLFEWSVLSIAIAGIMLWF